MLNNIRSIYEKEMKKKRKTKKRFVTNSIQKFQKSFRRFLRKIHFIMIYCVCSTLAVAGCGGEVSVLKQETMEDTSDTESARDNDRKSQDLLEEQKKEDTEHINTEPMIYIDVGGAVNQPGVYAIADGSRVFEVVALAGGFTEHAYVKTINQARVLIDGEQIYVYTVQEAEMLLEQSKLVNQEILENGSGVSSKESSSKDKVNLNLADKEALMTLEGIGATRADAILQYRVEHGMFRSIEELMQIDGIKEGTYEKIKHCITVQ